MTSIKQEVGRKVDHVPHDAHVCWSSADVLLCGLMLHHQSERYKSVKSSGSDFIELQPANKIISLPDCRFDLWAPTFWYLGDLENLTEKTFLKSPIVRYHHNTKRVRVS